MVLGVLTSQNLTLAGSDAHLKDAQPNAMLACPFVGGNCPGPCAHSAGRCTPRELTGDMARPSLPFPVTIT